MTQINNKQYEIVDLIICLSVAHTGVYIDARVHSGTYIL